MTDCNFDDFTNQDLTDYLADPDSMTEFERVDNCCLECAGQAKKLALKRLVHVCMERDMTPLQKAVIEDKLKGRHVTDTAQRLGVTYKKALVARNQATNILKTKLEYVVLYNRLVTRV